MLVYAIKFFTLIFLFSCASYQPVKHDHVISGKHPHKLPITARIDTKLTTKYYTVIQFTFGNMTSEWKRIQELSIDFNQKDLDEDIEIVLGQDLVNWSEAITHKKKIPEEIYFDIKYKAHEKVRYKVKIKNHAFNDFS